MNDEPITPQSILDQLDFATREFEFPIMDHGYIYPADVRLTVYRDADRWLMIIEMLGAYSPRTSGCASFQNCLYLFGNSLNRRCGPAPADFLYPINSLPDDPLFQEEYDWHIRPEACALGIRGRRVPFDVSAQALQARGISLIEPPNIDPPAVLRSLLPEHRDLLLATEQELEARNIYQLPKWMRLNEWCHPDVAEKELPGSCDTFQMLAEAIASGRTGDYCPTRPPNTRWQNWPLGGIL